MRMPVLVTSLSVGAPSTPIDARISSVIADSGLVCCSATRCPLSSSLYSAHAKSQCAAQIYPHRDGGATPHVRIMAATVAAPLVGARGRLDDSYPVWRQTPKGAHEGRPYERDTARLTNRNNAHLQHALRHADLHFVADTLSEQGPADRRFVADHALGRASF